MLNRPFKSAFARAAIFALVLALAIPFVSGGLTSAQEAVVDPCTMDESNVTCTFAENDTDAVADFSAMDPEQEGIEWDVQGPDAEFFDITGGVLTFKKAPDYENPADKGRPLVDDDTDTPDIDESVTLEAAANNDYLVTVKVTELLAEGQDPPALSTPLHVTVKVTDVDEPGSIDLSRLQPQVGVALEATLNDPDQGQIPATRRDHTIAEGAWEWSVPKVSRPVIDNDAHWQPAGGDLSTDTDAMDSYEPVVGDVDDVLRVKVTYQDAEGVNKKAYKISYHAVRAAVEAADKLASQVRHNHHRSLDT